MQALINSFGYNSKVILFRDRKIYCASGSGPTLCTLYTVLSRTLREAKECLKDRDLGSIIISETAPYWASANCCHHSGVFMCLLVAQDSAISFNPCKQGCVSRGRCNGLRRQNSITGSVICDGSQNIWKTGWD